MIVNKGFPHTAPKGAFFGPLSTFVRTHGQTAVVGVCRTASEPSPNASAFVLPVSAANLAPGVTAGRFFGGR